MQIHAGNLNAFFKEALGDLDDNLALVHIELNDGTSGRAKFNGLNISYKVASKHTLRGAKVAMAFDDLPYDEFFEQYGITVDQYTQV